MNGHTVATSDDDERQAKRQKLDSDSKEDVSAVVEENEIEKGDLYLDTVAFSLFVIYDLVLIRSIAPCWISTLKRSLSLSLLSRMNLGLLQICSVTTSTVNVYSCLICGKYLQGRGRTTPAYQHSLDQDHHVFINLDTLKVGYCCYDHDANASEQVYILPDLYEVDDPSLDDIRMLLKPSFTPQQLPLLSQGVSAYDLQKQPYIPGFIGLNNISQTSFMNAILQALLHVTPFRDYLIQESQIGAFESRSELIQRLAILCRKFWSPKLFKAQVSPHEFLQEVVTASGRKYKVTEAGDPLQFLAWLLQSLHRDLGGTRKPRSSIIYSLLQGHLRIEDQAVLVKTDQDLLGYGTTSKPTFSTDKEIKSSVTPFLFLSIDLPPLPVFQDSVEKNIIPQVTIGEVLSKFDGLSAQNVPAMGLRRYKITDLPPVLIMHFKRFTANNFVEEKNSTIVTYPLKGLDLDDCVFFIS